MPVLGGSDLDVRRLCLGGNVFGWTADDAASLAVLDAYAAAGGDFIDTADSYCAWVPGHVGGESEELIGRWTAARGNRDDVVIATKVGQLGGLEGLSRTTILQAADDSLRRLRTDRIDLYWAHFDDPETPMEETLGAFGELIDAGKVRAIGASNFTPERLAEALDVADREGLPRYVALQPHYNLVERDYEAGLAGVVAEGGLSTVPYFGLAKGFLTGKYRPGGAEVESARAPVASAYLQEGCAPVLEVLDEVAAAHDVRPAAAALAWLAAQPTVAAPIASARTVAQLDELLPALTLELTPDELARLSATTA